MVVECARTVRGRMAIATLVGSTLNEVYRVLELVGEGGFADVYLGRDLRTNEVVALKVLHPHLARNPALVSRFLEEAQVAQVLTEPHVVRVLDTGRDNGSIFIVMEYVQGLTLAEMIKKRGGAMPLKVAVGCL